MSIGRSVPESLLYILNVLMTGSTTQPDEYLAVVSGLSIGTDSQADAQIQMLVEYLSGEVGGQDDQVFAAQITRLIIAGNSLLSVADVEIGVEEDEKKPVRCYHQTAHIPDVPESEKIERGHSVGSLTAPQFHTLRPSP